MVTDKLCTSLNCPFSIRFPEIEDLPAAAVVAVSIAHADNRLVHLGIKRNFREAMVALVARIGVGEISAPFGSFLLPDRLQFRGLDQANLALQIKSVFQLTWVLSTYL
jgi:hypothetical protein